MMTNSEFFKAAHATARETRSNFATYRMAFSAALKGLYAMEKKASEKTTAEKLEEPGIDVWERGEMKRYYINSDKLDAVSEKWMQNREGRTVELNETLMASVRI